MTFSIVGCGNSAKEWFNTPVNKSIGVNDCLKWGKDTDYLLCVNEPQRFAPTQKNGYRNRLQVIKESSAKFITSLCPEWRKYKPDLECIRLTRFTKHYHRGSFFFTRTSTFIAIQYAHYLGAKDIILWGVDFIDHPDFKKERATDFEIYNYTKLFEFLSNDGVQVWIGNENTVLKEYLPVWSCNGGMAGFQNGVRDALTVEAEKNLAFCKNMESKN